ncbi:MAG: multicopper oxidase family protein [Planctomycetaceae bacterium]
MSDNPLRTSRRSLLTATSAALVGAAAIPTSASAADARARCAAPEFLQPSAVSGKWKRKLVLPEHLPEGVQSPGPNASEETLAAWSGKHAAHVMKPKGWIKTAEIRVALQDMDPSQHVIWKIYRQPGEGDFVPLDPPIRRAFADAGPKAVHPCPLSPHIQDRRQLGIAPEFWGIEGGFDPQHFWQLHEWIPFYEVVVGEFDAEIVPGLKTRVWGYNRQLPGPTFVEDVNRPIVVRYINELPAEISIHLHGGHTPAHSDGHPAFLVCAGRHEDGSLRLAYRDYFYTNGVPKKPDTDPLAPAGFDYSESQSTMWYHDHANDITAHNALMGLAGCYMVSDPWEKFLVAQHVLPAPDFYNSENSHDIPLVLGDRCLCRPTSEAPDVARIHFDPFDHNGYLGNIPVVNGMAWPRLEVKAHKYRFRLLNGSLARVFLLTLWDAGDLSQLTEEQLEGVLVSKDEDGTQYAKGGISSGMTCEGVSGGRSIDEPGVSGDPRASRPHPWVRIGKDSWLQGEPVWDDRILLAMANRADVIVDFNALLGDRPRATFFLVNLCDQRNGRGPGHGDNGLAAADGAGLPRGGRLSVPSLDDRERQRLAGDSGGGAKFEMLKILRIDVIRDETPDPCINFQPDLSPLTQLLRTHADHINSTPLLTDAAPRNAAGELLPKLRAHDNIIGRLTWQDIKNLPTRRFDFERGRGAWRVSQRFFDEERADATPVLGGLEVWHLVNRSGGWWHPIHIHLESHQQIYVDFAGRKMSRRDVNGALYPGVSIDLKAENALPHDCCKHDTSILGPNTEVMILMRFRTFRGPFVFHCHNLNHEDMRMMVTMDPRMEALGQVNPQQSDTQQGDRVDPEKTGYDILTLSTPLIPETLMKLQLNGHLPPVPAPVSVQQFFGDACHA